MTNQQLSIRQILEIIKLALEIILALIEFFRNL